MAWQNLVEEQQLKQIIQNSHSTTQVIFKHSTRCNISSTALGRMQAIINNTNFNFWLLDLLNHRSISNLIAQQFNVYHQSPQILIIQKGECVFDESHLAILPAEILEWQ